MNCIRNWGIKGIVQRVSNSIEDLDARTVDFVASKNCQAVDASTELQANRDVPLAPGTMRRIAPISPWGRG